MWIITGMHRSGTSLLARLFLEAGSPMGNPENFQKPDRWNPDGYFEQREIISLNMRLIHGLFWKFAYLRLPSPQTILRRGRNSAAAISDLASRYSASVVKDTRFCLTLPAWLAQGAAIRGILVCLREPHAVARSLRKRNHIGMKRGLRLWEEHMRRLLAATGAIPLWFVLYRRLLDPTFSHAETAGALRFAGLDLPDDRISEIRSACVKPEMDHHGPGDTPPGAENLMWGELLRRRAAQTGSGGDD